MKVNVEIDCTPDEARQFLGLPDLKPINELYVENVQKAMQGVTSLEQLQELAGQFAPMGQIGMKLFQNFMDSGSAFAGSSSTKAGGKRS
jgi:hypothetical protein